MFIDSHCHLSSEYYEDLNEVIEENNKANIKYMIISGCEKKGLEECINIVNENNNVYATIGYHPDQSNIIKDNDILLLEEYVKNNSKIIGIGEIGLDYHYDDTLKEKQKMLFEQQLGLAKKLNLPVVIHSRDATYDTILILKKYDLSGIIHCFSGSVETAKEYIDLGYKLGIGGVVTFKNSNLYKVIERFSLDNFVLETDAPFLSPEPYRGKKNSSKYIPVVAKKIAEIKGVSIDEVASITTKNCYDIFDLK